MQEVNFELDLEDLKERGRDGGRLIEGSNYFKYFHQKGGGGDYWRGD